MKLLSIKQRYRFQAVPCDSCGASIGKPCTDGRGTRKGREIRTFHVLRVLAAKRAESEQSLASRKAGDS